MIPTQFFLGKQPHIEAYRSCVIQLAEDIENKLKGEYVGMSKAIKELIFNTEGLDEGKRIKKTYELYVERAGGKWGNVLGRALLMLNTRSQDAEAEFESWIGDHAEENDTYKTYHSLFFG